MYFLVNASFPKQAEMSNFKLCSCIGHMKQRVLSNILCDLDPKVKEGIFLNTSPPKPSYTLQLYRSHDHTL